MVQNYKNLATFYGPPDNKNVPEVYSYLLTSKQIKWSRIVSAVRVTPTYRPGGPHTPCELPSTGFIYINIEINRVLSRHQGSMNHYCSCYY